MLTISVIIATHNRCEKLKDTLNSLLSIKATDKFSHEVIIVDNQSKDDTKKTVESCQDKFRGRLRYLFVEKKGKSNALNQAIRLSKSEIIAFTDDDVIVDENWLDQIAICLNSYECDVLGGRIIPILPARTPRWIVECKDVISGPLVMQDYGESVRPYEPSMAPFAGANMIVKREALAESGLFLATIGPGTSINGEDTELFSRLISLNKKIYYCGKALIWHPLDTKRMNLRYLARWYMASGRFAAMREMGEGKAFVHYFGVPRYLFRGIVQDGLQLCAHIFNRRKFISTWRSLFRRIGMIQGYRTIRGKK